MRQSTLAKAVRLFDTSIIVRARAAGTVSEVPVHIVHMKGGKPF